MTKYEAIFILNARKIIDGDESYGAKITKKLKKYHANLIKKDNLGRKQFARAIGKRKVGSYWSYVFEMLEVDVVEFQNEFRLDEVVIRLLVFKYDVPEKVKTLELEIR